MNFELFIAKKLTGRKGIISKPIIKIAIISIAIGIIVMLISIATGLGLKRKIQEKISGFNGHITISNFDKNQSKTTQYPIDIRQKFYPKFEDISDIRHIQVFATRPGIIRTKNDFEGFIFKGVDEHYNWNFFKTYLIDGEIPKFDGKISNQIIISKFLANRMKFELNDHFETFFIDKKSKNLPNRRNFKIVGIYDTGFEEFDKNLILGDIHQIRRINKWDDHQIGGFEIFLDDFERIEQKSKEIYQHIDHTLDSKSLFEQFPKIFEWLNLFDNNIAIIITIMIIVSAINMVTVLLVLILECTHIIAILKTMGATNWSIQKIFLHKISYIIAKGLLIGNTIGLTFLFLQHQFKLISLDPKNYYVHTAPVYITFTQIFLLNAGTLILCISIMILPSIIICRINPAKSIKFS